MAAFQADVLKFARTSSIPPPPGLAPPPSMLPVVKLSAQEKTPVGHRKDAAPVRVGLVGWVGADSDQKASQDPLNEEDSQSEASVTRMPSDESHRSLDFPLEELTCAPSIGSFGHPEMCSRPCVYFTWGPCPKGQKCGFCHLAHREPIGKLDKRQRRIFQKLGEAEMIALLLPHLIQRSKRFQSEVDACEVLEVLSSRLQELVPVGDAIQSITARKVDKLGYVLKQMPFQALVSLIVARVDFDEDFLDELTLATARLRAKMPAATSEPGSSLLWI